MLFGLAAQHAVFRPVLNSVLFLHRLIQKCNFSVITDISLVSKNARKMCFKHWAIVDAFCTLMDTGY